MGNWFATFSLFAWPVFALWLFASRPLNRAIVITILGAYLLLPAGTSYKLAPGIPELDKVAVSSIAALIGCLFIANVRLRIWRQFGIAETLYILFVFEPLITASLNGDLIVGGGGRILLPIGWYDGLSTVEGQCLILVPFLIGRSFLRTEADLIETFKIFIVAGLIYTIPALIEMRMSPQFHYWFYGYMPSEFYQEVREGGWRPMVFTGHGLLLSFFFAISASSAAAFWKLRIKATRFGASGVTFYLSTILLLCRSAGSSMYGILLIPLIRFAPIKLQLQVAVVLSGLALMYPLMRSADLVPTQTILEAADTYISADRAGSLNTRFEQEKALLDKASERFWFGWGRYGRNRVYADWGGDISITDGRWIITMGQFGLLGFLAEFGLLGVPVFAAAAALKFVKSKQDGVLLAALALMITVNLIDLLPNSSINSWTWLLAGALLGRSEALREASRRNYMNMVSNKPISFNLPGNAVSSDQTSASSNAPAVK